MQAALHVSTQVPQWPFNYTRSIPSVLSIYNLTLIPRYRVLIYSGSVDGCIPWIDSEWWTNGMGYPVSAEWRPWLLNTTRGVITGGYVTQFEAPSFTFLTVKGAYVGAAPHAGFIHGIGGATRWPRTCRFGPHGAAIQARGGTTHVQSVPVRAAVLICWRDAVRQRKCPCDDVCRSAHSCVDTCTVVQL